MTIETTQTFHSPKYWPLWLLVFVFWVLSHLPYRTQLKLGKWLGLLLFTLDRKNRRIAATNIEVCFPELNTAEKQTLLRKNFISIGIAIFETALAWWGSEKKLRPLIHLHGDNILKEALAEGKGAILCGAHFTSLELVGRLFALDHDFSVIYRKHKIPFVNHLISKIYAKNYFGMIERHDVRATLKRLKKGQTVWFTPDIDAGHFHNVFAPFFGIPASSLIASSRLPALTGAQLIPASFYRRQDGSGYDIYLAPTPNNFPSNDLEQDITRINQMTEDTIRLFPEQYLWQYKRFKTRPEGEKRIYT